MVDRGGIGSGLGSLSLLSSAETRSISAENPTGAKGKGGMAVDGTGAQAARDLGQGWKVSPCIAIAPRETAVLADINGAGVIQHIWITTHPQNWRRLVLRMYWDGDEQPAVQTPLGDFFCNGWCEYSPVVSQPIAVNPHGGLNSFWEMPFRQGARVTLESLADEAAPVFYQITYAESDVPAQAAYFHAQWRRSNPLPYKEVHTLLEDVHSSGHYVGTYLAWGVNNCGWWGEGEIKFYVDGDREFPTVCGTGTEDYFGGAWNFDVPGHGYTPFCAPFMGLSQVIRPDGLYRSQQRFGMYRWHIMDPIRFKTDLRVTIQGLGWRSGRRYLPLQDDIASTAFWYQKDTSTHHPFKAEPDALEVI
jgi:hypothetical protein